MWAEILDRLEAGIAEVFADGDPVPWDPPARAGPIPAELGERAQRILDAQLESMSLLSKIRNDAFAHLEALSIVLDDRSSARPLLLDVQG